MFACESLSPAVGHELLVQGPILLDQITDGLDLLASYPAGEKTPMTARGARPG